MNFSIDFVLQFMRMFRSVCGSLLWNDCRIWCTWKPIQLDLPWMASLKTAWLTSSNGRTELITFRTKCGILWWKTIQPDNSLRNNPPNYCCPLILFYFFNSGIFFPQFERMICLKPVYITRLYADCTEFEQRLNSCIVSIVAIKNKLKCTNCTI